MEFAFGGLGLIPNQNDAKIAMEGVSWNYTTWLNTAFLILATALLVRFFHTGGRDMLRMMGGAPHADHDHHHAGHHEGHGRDTAAGERYEGHHH
ncbi:MULTISPECIES: hypothetical protein [unclassified Streptomyces]|uniref:hypothetical protein n=1 Tax=unclassified Streptomyces TaxID=2593676 RepID=UPI003870D21F